jgi:hypothetical protein
MLLALLLVLIAVGQLLQFRRNVRFARHALNTQLLCEFDNDNETKKQNDWTRLGYLIERLLEIDLGRRLQIDIRQRQYLSVDDRIE